MDISRIEAGLFEIVHNTFDMVEVVSESIAEIRTYLPGKELEYKLELSDSVLSIVGDKMRISQVMRNLLSNAAKFSPAKGVVTIRVGASDQFSGICISVSDQGPGVPKADRERIFERFSQVDSSDQRTYGGTGLGLAITRQIVVAHAGYIGIANSSVGADFVVHLPNRSN